MSVQEAMPLDQFITDTLMPTKSASKPQRGFRAAAALCGADREV